LRDHAADPLDQLTQSAEASALARCLSLLDSQQRQSIALAFQHGLSHSELASHLQQPLGTIKTWIRRGLERLRSCLDGTRV
jgi:RNA polymerase sigma-70 factor (ECF subfamily)